MAAYPANPEEKRGLSRGKPEAGELSDREKAARAELRAARRREAMAANELREAEHSASAASKESEPAGREAARLRRYHDAAVAAVEAARSKIEGLC